jgi:hypothetical protein
MSPFGNGFASVTANRRDPGDGQGRGAMVPNQTPLPRSRRHVGTGPLGPVHGSGGSDGGGDHEDGASLGFPTSSPTGETVRRRSPPVKAQLWPEMSPVMGGWRGRAR